MNNEKNKNIYRWPIVLISLIIGLFATFPKLLFTNQFTIQVSFLGWAIPLFVSILSLINKRMIRLPILIWFPWVILVLTHLLLEPNFINLQRSLMLLSPIAIGVAFSKVDTDAVMLAKTSRFFELIFYFIILACLLFSAVLLVPGIEGEFSKATAVVSLSLGATWFATKLALDKKRIYLFLWLVICVIPVILVMRMGAVAIAATLPFTLAPLSVRKRLMSLLTIILFGLAAFQLESVQSKIFFSGSGTLEEAATSALGNLTGASSLLEDNFRTNARGAMHAEIRSELEDAYWLGNGINSVSKITNMYDLDHPHNEWLRIQYDFGAIGLYIFIISSFIQMIHAFRLSKKTNKTAALFLLAGSSAFIPMYLFMFSDNILLYVAWFGNLQFAMLGLGYANASVRSRSMQS